MANIIKVALLGDAKSLQHAASDATKALGKVETKGSSTAQKLAKYSAVAVAGLASVAVAAGAYAVKVGSQLQESQDNLSNALKDTKQSMSSFGGGLDALLKKNEKWGHTNAEVDDSLQTLIRSGVPAKKALTDEALAANFAAARHISLASATSIVTKVTTGHVALLGRYGIATKDAEGKTLSSAAALALLSQKYAGAADAAGGTFQGKIAAAKAQLTDTAAKIGEKLIPILLKLALFILNDVIPAIGAATNWIKTKLIPALVSFGLAVADAYNKYVRPYVASIVGTIEGIYTVVSRVVTFVNDLIHGRWSKLWGDAGQIVNGVITTIERWFSGLPAHLLGLVGKIGEAAEKIGKEIAARIVHGITSLPGKAFSLATSLVGKIPGLATGGIVTSPTLALVGEAGPEAVIPLHRLASTGGGRGGDFIVNMPAGIDPTAVVQAQARYNRRNGVT